MFEKLVVSTNTKGESRIGRFLAGTSITYIGLLAGSIAVSVIAASPKILMPSAELKTGMIAIQLSGGDQRATHPPGPRNGRSASSNIDFRHPFVDLQPEKRASTVPPVVGPICDSCVNSDDANGGDAGMSNGLAGGLGIDANDPGDPPPPKPARPTTPAQPKPQKPGAARQLRLSEKILLGKALIRKSPPYPPLAIKLHQEGNVNVEVVIGEDGHVESARAVGSSAMLLTAAAEQAAREWKFEPTYLNGVPVQVTGMITFVFKIDR